MGQPILKDLLKSTLRLQLGGLFVILISAAITVVSYSMLNNERTTLKRLMVKNGQEVVKNIAGNVTDALSQSPVDDTTLIYCINSTANGENKEWVRYVRITDPDNSLIIASNNIAEEWGKKYIPPVLSFDDINPYFIKDGEKVYDIEAPVKTPGKKQIGNVHLGISQKFVEQSIREATANVIFIAAIIIILGALFSIGLANYVSKPIAPLMEGVSKITSGNYDFEIKMKMHNELDDLTDSFNAMARNLKEKEQIKVAFSRYMSSELLGEVLKGKVQLGGEKRVVSVLFSDIRDFTSMAESLDAQEVVKLLNEYLTKMTEIIIKNKGMVNKYMGDAILAIYGAPMHLKDHARKAVNTALDMNRELDMLRRKWSDEKRPMIGMKIGITTGEVVVGNVGSKEHMEYTVIGDSVNVAARLQAMNKNYGTQILISESTYDLIKDEFECRKVELVQFKGKTAMTLVFEVLGYKTTRTTQKIEEEKK